MINSADLIEEIEPSDDVLREHLRALRHYVLGVLGALFAIGFTGSLHFLLLLLGIVFGLIPTTLIFVAVGALHAVQGIHKASDPALTDQVRLALCLSAPAAALIVVLLTWPAVWAGSFLGSLGKHVFGFEVYLDFFHLV